MDITQISPEGLRGRPKLVNVLETFRNFMESGFSSTRSPLVVCAPASVAPGQPVPDWSFQVSVGMTRNLSAKLVVELAKNLADADLQVVLKEVTSCFAGQGHSGAKSSRCLCIIDEVQVHHQ